MSVVTRHSHSPMSPDLTHTNEPNTVVLLDKSVWQGLKKEEMWTLNRVSSVALAPVLYEEIKSEVVPQRKRARIPADCLAAVAAKIDPERTFALPSRVEAGGS